MVLRQNIEFMGTKEEFFEEFKKKVVGTAYWTLPKEYRKSDEFNERSLDEQFEIALHSRQIVDVLEAVMEDYYDQLQDLDDY